MPDPSRRLAATSRLQRRRANEPRLILRYAAAAHRLSWWRARKRPPVVLLHGWPDDATPTRAFRRSFMRPASGRFRRVCGVLDGHRSCRKKPCDPAKLLQWRRTCWTLPTRLASAALRSSGTTGEHASPYRVGWGGRSPIPATRNWPAGKHRSFTVSTLTLHDRVVLTASSEGQEEHFTAPYERVVLDPVGHFPTREAPHEVSCLLASFLDSYGR